MSENRKAKSPSTRRDFLKVAAGTTGALALPWSYASAAPRLLGRPTGSQPMHGQLAEYQPRSREEQMIIQAITDRMKHAFVVAAANPTDGRFPANGYAAIAQRHFRNQSRADRAKASRRGKAMLKAPVRERRSQFGAFAEKGADIHRLIRPKNPVLSTQLNKVLREKLKEKAALTKLDAGIHKNLGPKIKLKVPKLGPGYTKLAFRINSVKCVEETNEVGSDEILLGGFATSPTGKMTKISKWKVSNDFDQGEKVTYYLPPSSNFSFNDPYRGRNLASFKLLDKFAFPGTWSLTLVMGEEDGGGFVDLMADLYDAVKGELVSLGKDIGESFGGWIGGLIGQIIGGFVEWLISIFATNKDDLVQVRTRELKLLSPFKKYFDTLPQTSVKHPSKVWMSPVTKWKFVGDGGRYDVNLHWRAYN